MTTLQEKLGYTFRDPALLALALTHKSFENENRRQTGEHNERLEFLGDAVLDLAVSDLLMARWQDYREGELSKIRASLVNETVLCEMARGLGLERKLRLGTGERRTGGHLKPRLLASALEALLGAIFVEAGYECCRQVLDRLYQERLEALDLSTHFAQDFKTRLQELVQERFKSTPVYIVAAAEGPDHDKVFSVQVVIQEKVLGTGTGKSKKQAEQEAARWAMEVLL